MRSILYFLTVLACLPTLAQNTGPYVVSTYQKDGKIVTDTIYDKETIRATNDLINGNFYIEKSEKSFNEKGQLILKKLNPPKGNVFNQTYIKYTY